MTSGLAKNNDTVGSLSKLWQKPQSGIDKSLADLPEIWQKTMKGDLLPFFCAQKFEAIKWGFQGSFVSLGFQCGSCCKYSR